MVLIYSPTLRDLPSARLEFDARLMVRMGSQRTIEASTQLTQNERFWHVLEET